MLNWLNILAIAYLAIAPGMNVERLMHSVNLCQFTAPAHVAAHAEHHGHSHTPEPESDDCPRVECDAPHSPAMPVVYAQPQLAAALPVLNPPALDVPASSSACRSSEDDARPPPGPELVGIVILLV